MSSPIHWLSKESFVCLNPAFSADQKRELTGLLEGCQERYPNHLFVLTSGTTAKSIHDFKWIALSKAAFLASAESVNRHLEVSSRDVWLHALPDFHVGGLGIWARSFVSGSKAVKWDQPWNPDQFTQAVEKNRATLASLVPTQIFDLALRKIRAPASLRAILVGGGALSFSLYEHAMDLGWPLLTTYGMTETCSQVATASLSSVDGFRRGKRVLPDLKILDHWEAQCEGEFLQFRGPSLLTSSIYRKRMGEGSVERVEEVRQTDWWTGQDRGAVENRTLKIFGRSGDFVKIGGESVDVGRLRNIFDRVCLEREMTKTVALLPIPNERLGHVMVVLAERSLEARTVDALIFIYNLRVLGFEKIRRIVWVDQIPRTSLGKLESARCLEMVFPSRSSSREEDREGTVQLS